MECPRCLAKWRLVRNGFYSRDFVDEECVTYRLAIQRVRCRECNASHSQLYDFLVPYRRLGAVAVKAAVRGYIEEPNTYLSAQTDVVGDCSAVYTAVALFLERLPVAWMYVMQVLVAAGFQVPDLLRQVKCPNSGRAQIAGKAERLDWAASVLALVPELFEVCAREGITLLASGRGCGLLRTHKTECKLF